MHVVMLPSNLPELSRRLIRQMDELHSWTLLPQFRLAGQAEATAAVGERNMPLNVRAIAQVLTFLVSHDLPVSRTSLDRLGLGRPKSGRLTRG
jgi:hypothetical protein